MKTASKRPAPWSETEDRLIVRDYLAMLALTQRGLPVNKSATRRALLPLLNGRNEGSIEFKRCNVTAVMRLLGHPELKGYLPRDNYQSRLVDIVRSELGQKEVAA